MPEDALLDDDAVLAAIGVVVVTFASSETIASCLRALPVGELGDVVVYDNASQDDTVEVVRGLDLPGVRLIEGPTNIGFGAGCNAGANAVRGDLRWLLFLNPDAVIQRRDILILARYLRDHPGVGAVGPALRDGTEPITSGGRIATPWTELRFVVPRRFGWVVKDRRLPPENTRTGRIGYIEGASMLFDWAVFRRVGMFDERYFLFFEEHDIARRLRRAGSDVHLVAEAVAVHQVGGSRRSTPMDARPAYYFSTFVYLRRWSGRIPAAMYRYVALLSWWMLQRTRKMDDDRADAFRSSLAAAVESPGE